MRKITTLLLIAIAVVAWNRLDESDWNRYPSRVVLQRSLFAHNSIRNSIPD
jgi:hypothetical protein